MMTRLLFSLVAATTLLSACGNLAGEVDHSFAKTNTQLNADQKKVIKQHVTSDVPVVQRTKKSWLGASSIALQTDATLPEVVRQDVTFRFPGKADIDTIAERITKVTHIPVSVKPDVYLPATAFITGGGKDLASSASASPSSGKGPATLPGGAPVPVATPPLATGFGGMGSTVSTSYSAVNDAKYEMNYEGPLTGYLDLLSSRSGISWDYRDGVISFRRLLTKIFTLKAIPGSSKFDSSIGKTGAGSTAGSGSSASFTSASQIEMKSDFGIWTSLDAAIKSMLSPSGKMSMSQATGDITVTDTKDVLDSVGHLIDKENATMTRQVAMRVEVLSVKLDRDNEYGIDWNAVFQSLNNNFRVSFATPQSGVSALTGNMGVSVLAPTDGATSTATQMKFGGTRAILHALSRFGPVSVVTTANAVTLNRQPVPVAITNSVGYVKETTPAASSVSGGSGGVPGLTTDTITTGFMLNLLPTVLDSNSVLLQFSIGMSDLTRLQTFTSGTGANQQSVQTPEVASTDFLQRVALRPGDTLVLAGYERDSRQYDKRTLGDNVSVGLGGSIVASGSRQAIVILVTPVLSQGAI